MKLTVQAIAMAVASIVLVGCGGGGASSSGVGNSGTVSPFTGVTTGVTQLNAELKTAYVNHAAPPSLFSPANLTFKTAYTAKPTDPQAAAGYAITTALVLTTDAYHALSGVNMPVGSNVPNFGVRGALAAPMMFSSGDFHFTDSGLGTVEDISGFRPDTTTSLRSLILTDAAKVKSEILPLKALLTGPLSDTLINGLEAKPVVLVDPSTGKSVSIGKAEMLAFRAAVKGAVGSLEVVTSYSYDIGTFNVDANPNVVLSAKILSGLSFSSTFLVPPSPFLTKTTNWGLEPYTMILGGSADTVSCVTAFKGRAGTKFLLNPVAIPPLKQAEITADANAVKSYLTSLQTVKMVYGGYHVSLTVNVGGFLKNLPVNLKALMPNIKAQPDPLFPGSHKMMVTTFPDLTFGGLVTNGASVLAGLQNKPILHDGKPADFEQAASFTDLYSLILNLTAGGGGSSGSPAIRMLVDWSPGKYAIQAYYEVNGNRNYGPWFEEGTALSSSVDFPTWDTGVAHFHADLFDDSKVNTPLVATFDRMVLVGSNQIMHLAAGPTHPPTALLLSPATAAFLKGHTQQFYAAGVDASSRYTFNPIGYLGWTTTGGVATITPDGLATGVKVGPGTVVAHFKTPVLVKAGAITVK